MRRLLAVAFACIIASGSGVARSAAPDAAPSRTVAYQVTPELEHGRLADLRVDISLAGDADGQTRMRLPDRWSGAEELWRAIRDIEADGGKLKRLSNNEIEVAHAPGAPIRVSYKVIQSFRGEMNVADGPPFRAVVRPDRFTSLGWALFAEVAGSLDRPVSFRWGDTPQGWTVGSDLDHGKVRTTGDLLDSVLVGGSNMQVVETEAAGGRIRIAMHGDWRFTPEQLSGLMVRIADASADFWGDKDEDFFVAVTPVVSDSGGGAQYGVGLGDAFSLWATTEVREPGLRHIVAHEHQHVWFPTRLGGVRTGRDEPLDYWLSEGFTDFYTLRLLLRSGLWTPEEFIADYNRILRDYANSPVVAAPNAIVPAGFWDDPHVADLPYQRGLMLATIWDHRLRRSSAGARDLDDVVLAMRERARTQSGQGNAVENLRAAYDQFGGSLDADFRNLVDAGQRVLLPEDLFGDCARIVTSEVRAFDRGFDSASTNAAGGVVAGVDPAGPAWRAGMRNGMRIIGRLSPPSENDSRVELLYQVRDRDADRVIRYRPEGARTVTLQEVVLTPGMDAATKAACARSMAGA